MNSKSLPRLAAGLLLAILFCLAFFSSRRWTPTYDEPAHYEYGLQILQLNPARFDDSKMPFSAFNALLPWAAQRLLAGRELSLHEQIGLGRVATILFALLLAGLVYRWGRQLYGTVPALFSLFLYVFEPNLIAHSALVTTDLYAAGMVLASVYALWRWTRRRTLANALLLGAVLGASQLAKYTCAYLYPLLAGILIVHDAPDWLKLARAGEWASLRRSLARLLALALVLALLSLLFINLGFLFDRTFTPLAGYSFRSELFQTLQARLEPLSRLPLPLPYPYLEGLDWTLFNERTGANFSRVYLLGRLSETGFPGYYLAASLFKVPLAIQIALGLAALAYLRCRAERRFWQDEWFLLAPVLFFTVYFNFFYRAQIGIRFFLVVFPFLLLFAGRLLLDWRCFGRWQWSGAAVLGVFLAASVLSYYPHFIPYFNELVPDRRLSYRILADSNLDWGQAGWYFDRYHAAHPELILNPPEPVAGRVAISANNLVGITAKPDTFAWLRENFIPDGTVAYSVLLFDISEEEIAGLMDE